MCKYFKPKCHRQICQFEKILLKFTNLTFFFKRKNCACVFSSAKNVQIYSAWSQLPNALRFMLLKHLPTKIECILYSASNVVLLCSVSTKNRQKSPKNAKNRQNTAQIAFFSFFQYLPDTFGTLHILTKLLKMHKSKCVRKAMN